MIDEIPYLTEVENFKYITKCKKRHTVMRVGDYVVESCKDSAVFGKYLVTHVDEEFGLVYGKKLGLNGSLYKNITCLSMLNYEISIDPQYITSLMLGTPYDPYKEIKTRNVAKAQMKANRASQRVVDVSDWKQWCKENLHEGQTFWMSSTNAFRDIQEITYAINEIGSESLTITSYFGWGSHIAYNDLSSMYIYLVKPSPWVP